MLRAEKLLFACLLVFSLALSCGDNGTEPANRPPNAPTNPSPANGATGQAIDVDLSWDCSDPDGDALTYGVAMLGIPPDTILSPNLTQPNFDPGPLNYGTVYGWAVIAMDEHGDTATSQMWVFTTVSGPANNPPATPSNPSPADEAINQSTSVQLSWSCSDPDGDDLTYDVYFGTSSTPPLVQSNHTATTYDPGTLQTNTTYYWKIIADDGTDQTEGPIWSFSTVLPGVYLVGTYTPPAYAWAVFVDGAYAYIADGLDGGLLIVDITNPSNPTLIGSYNTPNSARDVHKLGNYAYIADNQCCLVIVDVTNPVNPLPVGNYPVSWRTDGVFALGNYVYLPERDSVLMIIDVTTPSSPSLTGSYSTGDQSRAVYVLGDYAYVANFLSGLLILNISDPSSPSFVGEVALPDEAHGVYVAGNYAYVADYDSGLRIVDVSDPSTPSVIGIYAASGRALDVIVEGDYAYLAAYSGGLNILNVSNPASPTLVGGYTTPSAEARGVDKDDNYIYIVDGNSLLIVEFIQ